MNEWRRTRYIKAAGPSDRSDPQPTLTAAERAAVERAERCLMWQSAVEAVCEVRDDLPPHESVERAQDAATLRGLLERLSNPPTTDRP